MEQSLVLSIDACPGLGISPLRIKHLGELFVFLRPILAQNLLRCFFWGGGGVTLKVWIFCVKICAHSERNLNLMARVFEMRRIIEVREKMCFACTGEVDQSDQHGLFVPV